MDNKLKDKIIGGERISIEEAVLLFDWNLLDLGNLAAIREKQIHPEQKIGFIIDRIINYTNICEAKCLFCAYHAKAGSIPAYELSDEEILQKIKELVDAGGSQIMLQGGLHPKNSLEKFIHLIKLVKDNYPEIALHSFSPAEIFHVAQKESLSILDVVKSLKNVGLDSVPGASDLLVDRIRKRVSPNKISVEQWVDVMDALHKNEMKSSATMTYGMGETIEERIQHLNVIRDVQDKLGLFRAFIPWSFSPQNTEMQDVIPATGIDYLKVVSVARIFLDNVRYIQAGWLTEGLKLAQVALAMGANDMGGVLTEEVVVKATGVETSTSMNELIDIIKNAGKTAVLRDSDYKILKEF